MKTPGGFSPEDEAASDYLGGMANRDVECLKALYTLYHRPLLSLIHSVMGDSGGAEEILQDVFVRAYRDAGRYDSDLGAPFPWLATIARRMAIDWLRKKQRRPGIVDLEREQPERDADKIFAANENHPHQQMELRLIAEHLERLPEGQGQVLRMAFLQGHTHSEIAQILGKPLGTVKSDLRRGLLQLRKDYLGEND
ncbi:sigma-70 family RNA polymerase sigma factor [Puniceicoccales bacterium CK1056]|uniref:RNA polymerase sigma factor n=1 Tax=Oceanipulchritudo coccoides TaxID=2706888 RepID=A0A6B2M2R5_9BACT|nr:sigma-70 family RNA polymerase sigma factor [Oceanipulchritudo coccoides]NDV62686.1 sigma-70 family RNA polymerase sigma factor [Oceanipulchritudo coccoides]